MTNLKFKALTASLFRATCILAIPVVSILSIAPAYAQEPSPQLIFRYTPGVLGGAPQAPGTPDFDASASADFVDADSSGTLTPGDFVEVSYNLRNGGDTEAYGVIGTAFEHLSAGGSIAGSYSIDFENLTPGSHNPSLLAYLVSPGTWQIITAESVSLSYTVPSFPDGYVPPNALEFTAPVATFVDVDGDGFRSWGDQIRVTASVTNSQDKLLVFQATSYPEGHCEVVVGAGETQACEIVIESDLWWQWARSADYPGMIWFSSSTRDPDTNIALINGDETTHITLPDERWQDGYLADGGWSLSHNDNNGNGYHDVGETLTISREISNVWDGPVADLKVIVDAEIFELDHQTGNRLVLGNQSFNLNCGTHFLEGNSSTSCSATVELTSDWLPFHDNKSVLYSFVTKANGTNDSSDGFISIDEQHNPSKVPVPVEMTLSNGWKLTCQTRLPSSGFNDYLSTMHTDGLLRFDYTDDQNFRLWEYAPSVEHGYSDRTIIRVTTGTTTAIHLCETGTAAFIEEGTKASSTGITSTWRWL